MHYNSRKLKRGKKSAEALGIHSQQRTGLTAVFQVTFREAPDWWAALGQCDYLTLAVTTKLHFDGLQSL